MESIAISLVKATLWLELLSGNGWSEVVSGVEALHLFCGDTSERNLSLVGMVTAFLVSVVTIKFLINYIKKHDFKVFGWYRIVLGAVVIIYFLITL